MFTGLVEEIGKIKSVKKSNKSATITIEASDILHDVKLGDSICTNGVCLTVTGFNRNSFEVDVMPETMNKSNLHLLSTGDGVNLERALQANSRLGGHIVSGHIDGIGEITSFKTDENAIWVTIKTTSDVLRYIIYKGSIAIDGISLTVAYVNEDRFKVSIIPHTKTETVLLSKKVGDIVNLECDIIGKYVEKLLTHKQTQQEPKESKITMEYLSNNGFL